MEQQGDLDKCFPLVEFTYNNNFYASIGMTPFETLYGRKCTTPLYWYEIEETLILTPNMLQRYPEQVTIIKEKIITYQSHQKSYYGWR